jgi:hypothetical protein
VASLDPDPDVLAVARRKAGAAHASVRFHDVREVEVVTTATGSISVYVAHRD